ncbi:MAG: 50S ribosomal protein L3 [Kiritimatiellae bacterium]|nr:50S ribosomal protein L3 [Kiritimatiellia bacterium]
MDGLLGKKLGMTQVFGEDGEQIPVTVIEVGPCVVLQRKTAAKDGYDAVQLGFGGQKAHRVPRPMMGVFKRAGVDPSRWIREFRVAPGDAFKDGDVLTVSVFNGAAYVDVTAVTKGRGFQGVITRHGMARGPMSHGGHSKRRPGSIGQSSFPARVHKGKRMPGHMGHVNVTQRGLQVVDIREDDHLLLIRGSVPGPSGQVVEVRRSVKQRKQSS